MDYRFYTLSPDGRVLRATELDYPDDGCAIEAATDIERYGAAAELWEGARVVHRFAMDEVS